VIIQGVRAVLRLGALGLVIAWVVDEWLRRRADRAGRAEPAPFQTRIVMDAPIERVWRVVADVEGQPRWMHDMKSVRLGPGPVGVGSRGVATVRILGISTRDPVEIAEFEPPRRFAIRHLGTFTGHGVITLQPGADGTTTIVRWDETLVAPALSYVWATLAEPLMTAIFQADLERLRDLVEAEA
jgi:uncharacterized protein YndB with AHSA1/START domain